MHFTLLLSRAATKFRRPREGNMLPPGATAESISRVTAEHFPCDYRLLSRVARAPLRTSRNRFEFILSYLAELPGLN
eukprot:3013932-Pleurochrysis_carterae.AAC.2